MQLAHADFRKILMRAAGLNEHKIAGKERIVRRKGMRKEIDRYVQGLQEAFFARKMRPQFHFSSPSGWMNDPHAPVWYRGEYHLFFNYYPYDIEGVRPKCWGHAVTKDFTSYRLLPTAIAPDTVHDRDGCASGCAVVHEDRLYLLYTGRNYYRRPREVQCAAYSEDGIHFIKEEKNPVVLPLSCEEMDFRDPWVYRKDHRWQMLLGGKREGSPCIYRYESENLVDWTYSGIFAQGKEGQGSMWECPSLFQSGEKTILLASPEHIDGIRQKSLYFLGREIAGTFYQDAKKEVDYGCDFYAAQFFPFQDGAMMVNAWMNKWDNEHKTKTEGWIGTMTTPRTFSLGQDGKIKGEFINSLKKLRKKETHLSNISLEADKEFSFAEGKTSFWIKADVAWETMQGTSLEMAFLTDKAGENGLTITFEKNKNCLIVENHTVNHEEGRRSISMESDFWNRNLKMDILVDVSCVEILIAGELFITNCVYPNENSSGFHYCKCNGRMQIPQITIYDMNPINFQFEMQE